MSSKVGPWRMDRRSQAIRRIEADMQRLARSPSIVTRSKAFQDLSAAGGVVGPAGPTGPAGPAGLTWRGAWSSGLAYAVNDAVTYNGSSYRRIVAGTTFTAPNADAANWELLAAKGDTGATGSTGATGATGPTGPRGLTWRGAWAAATAYAVDDAVTYNGSSYRRTTAGTTATAPSADTTNWELLAAKGDPGTLSQTDSGVLNASGAFTGTARFIRTGSLVTVIAEISRATGSSTTFTNVGVTAPAGFLPPSAGFTFPASIQFNGSVTYRFRITGAGSLDLQQSAALTQTMTLTASYTAA